MVISQLDVNLYEITSGSNLAMTVYELVQWAESHGKTAELIRASLQWNPSNPALADFVSSLSFSIQQDKQTVPASSPRISAALRRALVDALQLIPGIKDFKVRSELMVGIPWRASLSPGLNDDRSDLETLVDQVDSLGKLKSGAWPLLILVDNAREFAGGSAAKAPLEKVFKRLQTFYQDK